MAAIGGDVSLVAEGRNGDVDRCRPVGARLSLRELHSPARVAVLLTAPCRVLAPILRDAASLDIRLLGIGVALLRRSDEARVHDLTRHGNIAGLVDGLIEAVEQLLDRAGAGQPPPSYTPA